MGCTPGDTHLLRQQIKKSKSEQRQAHERNITGRQVLWVTYHYFAMNDLDNYTLTAKDPKQRGFGKTFGKGLAVYYLGKTSGCKVWGFALLSFTDLGSESVLIMLGV